MRFRKNNSLLVIAAEFLSYIERRVGLFGRLSIGLVTGLLLGVGSLLLFAKLSEDLMFQELLVFDRTGTDIVRSISSPTVTFVMKQLSWLGSPELISLIGIGGIFYLGLVRRHFWDTLLVPLALAGGLILNETLKDLYQRQRPSLPHLVNVSGFSFPSGHSMMSLIFYGMAAYLIYVNFPDERHKKVRSVATFAAAVIIPAVGISRIYLGVHYPSDVLAGFAAGSFWLVACIYVLKGIRHYRADM